jgi:hypothetical protein
VRGREPEPDHPDAEYKVKPVVGRVERDEIRAALLVDQQAVEPEPRIPTRIKIAPISSVRSWAGDRSLVVRRSISPSSSKAAQSVPALYSEQDAASVR